MWSCMLAEVHRQHAQAHAGLPSSLQIVSIIQPSECPAPPPALPTSPPFPPHIPPGLLIAEVNINTMCEVGAGSGVSINYMAGRTLGPAGAAATSAAYVFLHYALLVAYISKAAAIVSEASGLPLLAAAGGFTAAFGGVCYGARPAQMDALNGALVVAVVGSFVVRGEGGGRGAGARGKGEGAGGRGKGQGEGGRGRGKGKGEEEEGGVAAVVGSSC